MTTLYLKYRPQRISELDLTSVRELLSKIVSSGNIPHAFLFEGPRGSGKTSAARILAKVLNCEHPSKDKEPCNKCGQCISITKGTNIDVVELDAASHRGIDDVRLIRESVKLAPAAAKKKVYIIDEAHMLTTEASNALLKTLEEPPGHVVFILATTNPEKLLDTIKSRTIRVVFKKATSAEIVKSLTNVLEKEKEKYQISVLELISQNVDGSLRDAKKLLEELMMKNVLSDLEKAQNYLLNKSDFNVEDLFDNLYAKNLKGGIQLLNKAEISGVPSKSVYSQIIGKLKSFLFSVTGFKNDAGNKFDRQAVLEMTDVFINYWKMYQNDISEYLPLYLSVTRWCEDTKQGGETHNEKKPEIKTAKSEKGDKDSSDLDMKDGDNVPDTVNGRTRSASVIEKSISDDIWKEILLKIRNINVSTEALLRASKPINFDGKTLSLGVFYKFHKEKLESLPHKICLENTLRDAMGGEIKVECFLTQPDPFLKKANTSDSNVTDGTQKAEFTKGSGAAEVVLTDVADLTIEKLADEVFGS